ncbi:unnamed protein product [Mytilus coruscus]|uniref:Uncharacterized protein n=1 Tax=Mytilus coruscus TaxID=42192 RepID=A0A6J8A1E0_MYTCO|nr:unnamed protein product [Mytilus coruscus]
MTTLAYRKVDANGEKVNWLKIKWLRFSKPKPQHMFFKHTFDEDFRRLRVIELDKMEFLLQLLEDTNCQENTTESKQLHWQRKRIFFTIAKPRLLPLNIKFCKDLPAYGEVHGNLPDPDVEEEEHDSDKSDRLLINYSLNILQKIEGHRAGQNGVSATIIRGYELPRKYNGKQTITLAKKKDLFTHCKAKVITAEYHKFCKDLPAYGEVHGNLPDPDVEEEEHDSDKSDRLLINYRLNMLKILKICFDEDDLDNDEEIAPFEDTWIRKSLETRALPFDKEKSLNFDFQTFTQSIECTNFKAALLKKPSKEEKKEIIEMKTAHLELQRLCSQKYYKHNNKAQEDPDQYLYLIIDGMDQAKTNLPRFHNIQKW